MFLLEPKRLQNLILWRLLKTCEELALPSYAVLAIKALVLQQTSQLRILELTVSPIVILSVSKLIFM